MLALLRHRDQLAALRRYPEFIPAALQELLRYDSLVQLSTRIPGEDVVFGDARIPAGSLVFVSLGAANRDPLRFPDADRLDIFRSDKRHLAFSAGIHHCLGSPLALLEAQAALSAMIVQLDDLELEPEPGIIEWQPEIIFRGPRSLPVTFSPRTA